MIPALLAVTAIIAYFFGSMSTPILTSHIYFHENLLKYSRDNAGMTRFYKRYGRNGVIVLALCEILKTVIPMIICGLIMLIADQMKIGYAFALFCIVMGTDFPIMYRFKGEPSLIAMFVGTFFISGEVAAAGIIIFVIVYLASKYISLSALVSALFMALVAVMSVDDNIVRNIFLITCLLVFVEYRKNIGRLLRGKEKKFRFREDVSYMFDDDYGSGER